MPIPRRRPARVLRLLTTVALAAGCLPLATTDAAASSATSRTVTTASAPFCGLVWGSLPKQAGVLSPAAAVTGVRAGRHLCWDRLVVDVRGRLLGYDVRYVTVVRAEGSGQAVPVRGGAAIAVVVKASSYDPLTGQPTYQPSDPRELVGVSGFRTVRQVAWAGSFEGQTTLALGVRARLPFRVSVLAGPGSGSRLVVDVAHLW